MSSVSEEIALFVIVVIVIGKLTFLKLIFSLFYFSLGAEQGKWGALTVNPLFPQLNANGSSEELLPALLLLISFSIRVRY